MAADLSAELAERVQRMRQGLIDAQIIRAMQAANVTSADIQAGLVRCHIVTQRDHECHGAGTIVSHPTPHRVDVQLCSCVEVRLVRRIDGT